MLSSRHRTKSRALHYEQEEELPLLPEAKLRKIGPKMTKPSKTLAQRLSLAYYRFGLITGSEMLDPWERALFNLVAVGLFALISYNIWAYGFESLYFRH